MLSIVKPQLWNCIRVCCVWHVIAVRYLWRSFYLSSDPLTYTTYQNQLFRVLEANPTAWRGFCFTKDLILNFNYNNQGFPVSTKAHCLSIVTEFERMQFVLHWAAPYIETLELDLEPFIRDDAEGEDPSHYLECANSIIQSVVMLVSDVANYRDVQVTLVIGWPHWRYYSDSRIGVQEIISILGPFLTGLHLSEPSVLECCRWVSSNQARTIVADTGFA
jgi:hypothetical protein